jgi:hypothetical protein
MSRGFVLFFLLLVPMIAFAHPAFPRSSADPFSPMGADIQLGPYFDAEIASIESEYGAGAYDGFAAGKFGDLTLNQMVPLWSRLNVAVQKDNYVNRVGTMSFLLPGLGQFSTGNVGLGVGMLSLHVSVLAGSLYWAYICLPSDLRFDKLDYTSASFDTISTTWNKHDIKDYLPSIGALAAGMAVNFALRVWSASSARDEAKENVDRGQVKFKPIISPGFLGFQVTPRF